MIIKKKKRKPYIPTSTQNFKTIFIICHECMYLYCWICIAFFNIVSSCCYWKQTVNVCRPKHFDIMLCSSLTIDIMLCLSQTADIMFCPSQIASWHHVVIVSDSWHHVAFDADSWHHYAAFFFLVGLEDILFIYFLTFVCALNIFWNRVWLLWARKKWQVQRKT